MKHLTLASVILFVIACSGLAVAQTAEQRFDRRLDRWYRAARATTEGRGTFGNQEWKRGWLRGMVTPRRDGDTNGRSVQLTFAGKGRMQLERHVVDYGVTRGGTVLGKSDYVSWRWCRDPDERDSVRREWDQLTMHTSYSNGRAVRQFTFNGHGISKGEAKQILSSRPKFRMERSKLTRQTRERLVPERRFGRPLGLVRRAMRALHR